MTGQCAGSWPDCWRLTTRLVNNQSPGAQRSPRMTDQTAGDWPLAWYTISLQVPNPVPLWLTRLLVTDQLLGKQSVPTWPTQSPQDWPDCWRLTIHLVNNQSPGNWPDWLVADQSLVKQVVPRWPTQSPYDWPDWLVTDQSLVIQVVPWWPASLLMTGQSPGDWPDCWWMTSPVLASHEVLLQWLPIVSTYRCKFMKLCYELWDKLIDCSYLLLKIHWKNAEIKFVLKKKRSGLASVWLKWNIRVFVSCNDQWWSKFGRPAIGAWQIVSAASVLHTMKCAKLQNFVQWLRLLSVI